MKILTLSIKQKYFDDILAKIKTSEFREIRPANFKKYARLVVGGSWDKKTGKYLGGGKEYENPKEAPDNGENWGVIAVKCDALKLITGAYNLPKRPYLTIEVKEAWVDLLLDSEKKDEYLILTDEKGEEYIAAEVEYVLGEILEKQLYE